MAAEDVEDSRASPEDLEALDSISRTAMEVVQVRQQMEELCVELAKRRHGLDCEGSVDDLEPQTWERTKEPIRPKRSSQPRTASEGGSSCSASLHGCSCEPADLWLQARVGPGDRRAALQRAARLLLRLDR
mmetsp:Transcript_15564/g.35455  ORF Transcript_15564/g.35455 Transcript_15564/m.35455 type:complete len:131 (-) Transcript_15564:46-438(-)